MKRIFLLILFFLPAVIALGQDTIDIDEDIKKIGSLDTFGDTTYFDKDWKEISSFKHAVYYKIMLHDPTDTNIVMKTEYFMSGQINNIQNYKNNKLDGKSKEWYENGQLQKDISYRKDRLHGRVLTYWDNGNPRRKDYFRNDTLVTGTCMTYDGKDTSHYDYRKMPEYQGGENALLQFLVKNIQYPLSAIDYNIQGVVLVGFVIEKDGSITNIKVEHDIGRGCGFEAVRAVKKMPKWIPGMVEGEVVRTSFTLPIHFRLR